MQDQTHMKLVPRCALMFGYSIISDKFQKKAHQNDQGQQFWKNRPQTGLIIPQSFWHNAISIVVLLKMPGFNRILESKIVALNIFKVCHFSKLQQVLCVRQTTEIIRKFRRFYQLKQSSIASGEKTNLQLSPSYFFLVAIMLHFPSVRYICLYASAGHISLFKFNEKLDGNLLITNLLSNFSKLKRTL